MKKFILAIAMVLGVSQAQAHSVPAWVCSMGFRGASEGFKLIYGSYAFNGRGSLLCTSPGGKTVNYPVIITMNARKFSPQVSFGRMKLVGKAVEFALFERNPEDILGTYYIAQGQAAVIGGAGAITATKVGFPEIVLHVSLQFARGLGVNLGLNKMVIALDTHESAPILEPEPEEPIPAPAPAPN